MYAELSKELNPCNIWTVFFVLFFYCFKFDEVLQSNSLNYTIERKQLCDDNK